MLNEERWNRCRRPAPPEMRLNRFLGARAETIISRVLQPGAGTGAFVHAATASYPGAQSLPRYPTELAKLANAVQMS